MSLGTLEINKCSKCKQENKEIVLRWYDLESTKCCRDCYNEIHKYVENILSQNNKSES